MFLKAGSRGKRKGPTACTPQGLLRGSNTHLRVSLYILQTSVMGKVSLSSLPSSEVEQNMEAMRTAAETIRERRLSLQFREDTVSAR